MESRVEPAVAIDSVVIVQSTAPYKVLQHHGLKKRRRLCHLLIRGTGVFSCLKDHNSQRSESKMVHDYASVREELPLQMTIAWQTLGSPVIEFNLGYLDHLIG